MPPQHRQQQIATRRCSTRQALTVPDNVGERLFFRRGQGPAILVKVRDSRDQRGICPKLPDEGLDFWASRSWRSADAGLS